MRLAQAWLDPGLAREAENALGKILSVLPAAVRAAAESVALYAPMASLSEQAKQTLQLLQSLREAVNARHQVSFGYCDLTGRSSQRVVRPLGCFFWGKVWTLAAWCESRQDFRSFRIDRIEALELLEERFRDEPEKTLAQLLRKVGANINN